jgi:hypothetical protein
VDCLHVVHEIVHVMEYIVIWWLHVVATAQLASQNVHFARLVLFEEVLA